MRDAMCQAYPDREAIDLGGEQRGSRRDGNLFGIRTPVAITTLRKVGSETKYARIAGRTVTEKKENLEKPLSWLPMVKGGMFLPEMADKSYASWPTAMDLFRLVISGSQFSRRWVIAPNKETLLWRWETFLKDRDRYFQSSRGRDIRKPYLDLLDPSKILRPLIEETELPRIVPYGYRSFDHHHWAFADSRLGDHLRPDIWRQHNENQLYLISKFTGLLGSGPGAVVTDLVPDIHHFNCGHSGKDVIPYLWEGSPNETIPDLFFYVLAVMGHPGYTQRFAKEAHHCPRIPVTKDPDLYRRAVELGKELTEIQTYRRIPEDVPLPTSFVMSHMNVIERWVSYREGGGRKSSELDSLFVPFAYKDQKAQLLRVLGATMQLYPKMEALLSELLKSKLL